MFHNVLAYWWKGEKMEKEANSKMRGILIGISLIVLVMIVIAIYFWAYNKHKEATYEKEMTEYYISKMQER